MKTDNYLSLCLEQAAHSPLHYRHGAIVVRGGKVIGQGYNAYRHGYDGGALKHGRIANGGYDGYAVAELKQKQKHKTKPKQQSGMSNNNGSFTPFERTNGGGHHANVPLSMHSEMMAIHSALAVSATLASTASACEKPCFKLPGHSKRKQRLWQGVLQQFKSAVLKMPHLNQVNLDRNNSGKEEDGEKQALRREKESHRAFHGGVGGVKHQKRKENEKRKGLQDQYEYRYHHGQNDVPSGQQTQPRQLQQQRSALKKSDNDGRLTHNEATISASAAGNSTTSVKQKAEVLHSKLKMTRKKKAPNKCEQPQPEPMLFPTGHCGQNVKASERKKHPRLTGADLYVARLGWCKESNKRSTVATVALHLVAPALSATASTVGSDEEIEDNSSLASSTSSLRSTSTGSLHDELRNPLPSPGHRIAPTDPDAHLERRDVHASRPCYRCISYMHSVGIKRVFWTNDAGDWEGSKVRDLVEALETSMDAAKDGNAGDPTGKGVFVTKHEVLMLRRLMGDGP